MSATGVPEAFTNVTLGTNVLLKGSVVANSTTLPVLSVLKKYMSLSVADMFVPATVATQWPDAPWAEVRALAPLMESLA